MRLRMIFLSMDHLHGNIRTFHMKFLIVSTEYNEVSKKMIGKYDQFTEQ